MIGCTLKTFGVPAVRGDEAYVNRAINTPISLEDYKALKDIVKFVGVTDEFKNVIETFKTPEGETPAGFRREYKLAADGVLLIDLVRDISYDKNGELRPTKVLFSADSANPYEVAPISPLLANLTCNPGIVYDLFINNPKANVGGLYKTRDEVMAEIGRVLGPGCDISVELNNPFEKDFNLILEECEKFKEMFSKYRVVIKVPHTGAVNPDNVNQLLEGDKKLANNYTDVQTGEALRGHNLCLKLTEAGYRINFTLMFEPYQTQLALQARPYFINTFLRHRLVQTTNMKKFVDAYEATGDKKQLEALKTFLYSVDYFSPAEIDNVSLDEVYRLAKDTIKYRQFETAQGSDGLDGMRHNLRMLRNCNMPDTRLIVCSMEGPYNYPDIDKLLAEPEFLDMHHKVVITAEPNYLARFTSTNQVTSYQRRFMNAAKGQK
ncbi:MAG: transaldolase family protein [Christensenellales bacterium]|jgi:transaldolase